MASFNAVCVGPTRNHAPRVLAVLDRDGSSNWGATVRSAEAEGYCAPSGTSGAPTWTSTCPHCGASNVLPAATLATRADTALADPHLTALVNVAVTA